MKTKTLLKLDGFILEVDENCFMVGENRENKKDKSKSYVANQKFFPSVIQALVYMADQISREKAETLQEYVQLIIKKTDELKNMLKKAGIKE